VLFDAQPGTDERDVLGDPRGGPSPVEVRVVDDHAGAQTAGRPQAGCGVSNTRGIATTSVYSATKAALRSLTRTFARELIDRGIRVNAVSPGPIDTGILERTMPAAAARQFLEQVKATNPMGRSGEPEEVARAILYLGFDATYTTGTELVVDGGVSDRDR